MTHTDELTNPKETAGTLPTRPGLPYLALGVAVTAVSFAAVLVRLTTAPPVAVAFYRLLFSTLLLLPMLLAQLRRGRGTFQAGVKGRKSVALACLSGVFLALHYFTWFQSLRLTTVTSSTVLVTLHPFFVLFMGFMLWREQITSRLVLALVVTLIGGYIIGSQDLQVAKDYLVGDLLALVAAFFMAGYLLLGQVVRRQLSVLEYVTVVYGVGSIVAALIMVSSGVAILGYSGRDYLILLGLAVVPNLLGHTLFNWALAYLPASTISVSVLAEPVGATVLAMIMLHEAPSAAQIIGGSIIVAGIGWFLVEKSRIPFRKRKQVDNIEHIGS